MYFATVRSLFAYRIGFLAWLLVQFYIQTTSSQPVDAVGYGGAHDETLTDLAPRLPIYPTERQVKQALNSGQPPKDAALYWTGFHPDSDKYSASIQIMVGYSMRNKLTSVASPWVWKTSDYIVDNNYQGTANDKLAFNKAIYTLFGKNTQGKVYLFMPFNTAPAQDSYFWNWEWPAMKNSGKVTKIYWIDSSVFPDYTKIPDIGAVTATWWEGGDTEPATRPEKDPDPKVPQARG